ncbi:SPFH domain-containing protein [Thomasclavelia saccharogumia]|uniref:SPFH domain-containing protein n=1 Tax=Thomasclavelia saccharogumia TaxID=341225 RepID=UPI00047A5DC9|nr:SPFH domain-containing protein [Thomasclavelia saccharogumia]
MGLIKAISGSMGGTLANQWKEFFYCEAMNKDVLVTKGVKKSSNRSSNSKGDDNIISRGSGIAVADGQCMIIVQQGKIVEMCAEPGEFTFDSSTEPSIFTGNLGDSVMETFGTMIKRFTYGGDTGKDQRIYYLNLKEIIDNKYGTANPIPFRVVDDNIGLDIDISIRCHGTYSYKIVDPLLFYVNVCGNVRNEFKREEIDSTLKGELLTALQPAFARISDIGIRYSRLPGHTIEIVDALNEILSEKWQQLRGIKIVSLAINSVVANKEDEELIKKAQRTAILKNPSMAAATLVEAQSEALKKAADNDGGAMLGFMGMNMVQNVDNLNTQNLYEMSQKQQEKVKKAKEEWICSCKTKNTGKFCIECGKPKVVGWVCKCGNINKGKFCSECGKPKPLDEPLYRCDKCGWEPEDPRHPPKFCPECGDVFDDNDKR